ncbi:unnamed protein product, partial [Heterosigma akashiwo]
RRLEPEPQGAAPLLRVQDRAVLPDAGRDQLFRGLIISKAMRTSQPGA